MGRALSWYAWLFSVGTGLSFYLQYFFISLFMLYIHPNCSLRYLWIFNGKLIKRPFSGKNTSCAPPHLYLAEVQSDWLPGRLPPIYFLSSAILTSYRKMSLSFSLIWGIQHWGLLPHLFSPDSSLFIEISWLSLLICVKLSFLFLSDESILLMLWNRKSIVQRDCLFFL